MGVLTTEQIEKLPPGTKIRVRSGSHKGTWVKLMPAGDSSELFACIETGRVCHYSWLSEPVDEARPMLRKKVTKTTVRDE